MKTKLLKSTALLLLLLVNFSSCGKDNASTPSLELNYDCDIDNENYMLIDSFMIEPSLIDQTGVQKTLYDKYQMKLPLIITNKKEYELFKTQDARDIDFEQYNLFVVFFPIYSCCEPVRKVSLLRDTIEKKYILSIVIFGDFCKRGGQNHPPSVFLISKKQSNSLHKICYIQKPRLCYDEN